MSDPERYIAVYPDGQRRSVTGGLLIPMCAECGVLVWDERLHDEWHERVTDEV